MMRNVYSLIDCLLPGRVYLKPRAFILLIIEESRGKRPRQPKSRIMNTACRETSESQVIVPGAAMPEKRSHATDAILPYYIFNDFLSYVPAVITGQTFRQLNKFLKSHANMKPVKYQCQSDKKSLLKSAITISRV